MEDVLPDVRSLVNSDCDLPTSAFDAVGFGRYLRFTAKDYYGRGAGLNHMTWRFET